MAFKAKTLFFPNASLAEVPKSVPDLLAWWNPSRETSVTMNASRVVSQVNDLAGTAHLTQVTEAKRPSLTIGDSTGINNKATLYWDGTVEVWLQNALNYAQPYSVFLVEKADSAAGTQNFHFSSSGNTWLAYDSSNNIWVYAGSTIGKASTRGAVIIWCCIYNGASSELFKNGTSFLTGNPGANNLNNIIVGYHTSGFFPWDGHICEIIIYNGAISADNRAIVESYLKRQWGVV